jgi:CpeT protein
MNMKYLSVVLLAFMLLQGCKGGTDLNDQDLLELKAMMVGSFSSAEQAARDTNYFDIRLEMVEIWPEEPEADWLYVEQAAAWSLEQPYRQRVYRLSRSGSGELLSAVYTLASPQRFAGAYRDLALLENLTPDSLTEREGCAIVLQRKGEVFVGSTIEDRCKSSLRGASYATSEVKISPTELQSWDRGFNAAGEQVWGAELGPYVFKKFIQ